MASPEDHHGPVFPVRPARCRSRSLAHPDHFACRRSSASVSALASTTAISSAIDRAMLQAPPFAAPDRLVTVYRTTPQFNTGPFSAPNYTDLSQQSKQLSALAAVSYATSLLTLPGDATRVNVLQVSGNLFPMLGVRAQVGRLLTPGDDARDQNKVAVLSDELWHERFRRRSGHRRQDRADRWRQGDRGRHHAARIPDSARRPGAARSDLDTAALLRPATRRSGAATFSRSLARLAPGATVASAQAEMNRLFAVWSPSIRIFAAKVSTSSRCIADANAGIRTPLLLVFGAVIMVLLIAATDVASLPSGQRRASPARNGHSFGTRRRPLGGDAASAARKHSARRSRCRAGPGAGLVWCAHHRHARRATPSATGRPDRRPSRHCLCAGARARSSQSHAARCPHGAAPPSIHRMRFATVAVAAWARTAPCARLCSWSSRWHCRWC